MKKGGDIINESSINDLIRYTENDGEDNTPEKQEEAPETDFDDDFSAAVNFDDGFYEEPEEEEIVFEKEPKGTRAGVIIGIIVGLIAVIAFISIDSGIIGNYKSNFAKNFSNIFANFKPDSREEIVPPTVKLETPYNTEVAKNVIIPLENTNDTEFAPYKNGILCAGMNHISYIDNTGATVWELDTVIVDPILKTGGNYILLAEKGRNKICLYNDKRLVYEADDPDIIEAAKVSSNGDAVIVTDKASYKGGISVYNKSGAQIFSWASGSDAVISADISSASRRVAVALLNTDLYAKSTIQLFDVNETGSFAKIDVDNTVIFDVDFTGDTLSAFGDNRIIGVSAAGKLLYDNTFETVQLTHSAIDDNGNKLLSFADGNTPMLSMYAEKGTLRDSAALTGITDFIDINNRDVLYNTGRDVYFGKLNSKNITKYTATMDIRNLYIISGNAFAIVYSNSIELVTV